MKSPNLMRIPIGFGEFFDRLIIWELKSERFVVAEHLPQVYEHLEMLRQFEHELAIDADLLPSLDGLRSALRDTNMALWDVEHLLRKHELQNDFGLSYIELARSVHSLNDRRSALKADIDRLFSIRPQDPKE